MKHAVKKHNKLIALLLALALLVSMLPVGFSLANEVENYVIAIEKPALPVEKGVTYDLSKVDIALSDSETISGADITWSTTDDAIILENGLATVLSDGAHLLTATVGDNAYSVVLVAVDETGEYRIFEENFTADFDLAALKADANADGKDDHPVWNAFETNSYLTYKSNSLSHLNYNTAYTGDTSVFSGMDLEVKFGIQTVTNTSYMVYVDPESTEGKTLSLFRDINVDYAVTFHKKAALNGSYGVLTHLNLGENGYDGADETFLALLPYHSTTSNKFASPKFDLVSGTGQSFLTVSSAAGSPAFNATYPTYTVTSNPHEARPTINNRIEFNGSGEANTLKWSFTSTSASATNSANSVWDSTADEALDSAIQSRLDSVTSGGTIALYLSALSRLPIGYVNVTIDFTPEEISAVAALVADGYYLVDSTKPAFPAEIGYSYNLDKFVVELSDGSFAKGSDLVWTADSGVAVNNETFTAILTEAGTYKLTATNGTASAEIYAMSKATNGKYQIFKYTFGASDVAALYDKTGAAITSIASKTSAYLGTYNGTWMIDNIGSNAATPSYASSSGVLCSGQQYYTLYVNPNSAAAELLSVFPNYTVEYTAKTTHGSGTGDFGALFRVIPPTQSGKLISPNGFRNGDIVGDDEYVYIGVYNNKTPALPYVRVSNAGNTSAPSLSESGVTIGVAANTKMYYRTEIDGTSAKQYLSSNGSSYTFINNTSFTPYQKIVVSELKNTAGTLGFYSGEPSRAYYDNILAYLTFNEVEAAVPCTEIEYKAVLGAEGTEVAADEKLFTDLGVAIDFLGTEGGTIYVKGAVTVDNLVSESSTNHGDILITSYNGVAAENTITVTSVDNVIYGNITFKNVTVKKGTYISTGSNYTLTFGEGTVVSFDRFAASSPSRATNLVIDSDNATINGNPTYTHINPNGGSYAISSKIVIKRATVTGNYYITNGIFTNNGGSGATLNGNLELDVQGGSYYSLNMGPSGSIGGNKPTTVKGNSILRVNGGTYSYTYFVLGGTTSNTSISEHNMHNIAIIVDSAKLSQNITVTGNTISSKFVKVNDNSKWIVVVNNAQENRVSVRSDGSAYDLKGLLDYSVAAYNGIAQPIFSEVTTGNAADSVLLGFTLEANTEGNNAYIGTTRLAPTGQKTADGKDIYDLSSYITDEDGKDVVIEFLSEKELPVDYEEFTPEEFEELKKPETAAPEKEGYLFAGWYADASSETAMTAAQLAEAETAVAKFIPKAVLDVKWQLGAGANGTADLRLISTVDSLQYQKVIFNVDVVGRATPFKPLESTTVYTGIKSYVDGNAQNHAPTINSASSAYFMTHIIKGIPVDFHDNDFTVTASVVTKDGKVITGDPITFQLEDATDYNDIIGNK